MQSVNYQHILYKLVGLNANNTTYLFITQSKYAIETLDLYCSLVYNRFVQVLPLQSSWLILAVLVVVSVCQNECDI